MTLGQFLVLHLMAGAGVAVAVFVAGPGSRATGRWFQVATAFLFWPLYLPLLLARPAPAQKRLDESALVAPPAGDELDSAIARVDAELEGALQSLDGWAEDVLAREQGRLHELRAAWVMQAQRIREMDRLLGRPEQAEADAAPAPIGHDLPPSPRLLSSRHVIRQNRERLRQVRTRALQGLLETLAWVRELVSMIHLAKFTGAPAARAEELVAQIAAAVEGLSDLTWQREPLLEHSPGQSPVG